MTPRDVESLADQRYAGLVIWSNNNTNGTRTDLVVLPGSVDGAQSADHQFDTLAIGVDAALTDTQLAGRVQSKQLGNQKEKNNETIHSVLLLKNDTFRRSGRKIVRKTVNYCKLEKQVRSKVEKRNPRQVSSFLFFLRDMQIFDYSADETLW